MRIMAVELLQPAYIRYIPEGQQQCYDISANLLEGSYLSMKMVCCFSMHCFVP